MSKEFSRLIKESLKKKNISLRELSRQCKLDVSFLSKILNSKRNPPSSEKDIRRIAKLLDILPEKLIFASGRIPEELQEVFSEEEFIDLILRRKKESKKEIKKETGPVQYSNTSEIEDELL